MTTLTPRSELLISLERHNATFTTLLSLIPPRYYITPTPEEADNRWMKSKKRKTGEELKEHKRRVKLDKLDPANNLTTDQILASTAPTTQITAGPSSRTIQPLPPAASISELRAKLQSKLDSFRRDRGLDDDTEPQSRDTLEASRRAKRGEVRDRRRKERKKERGVGQPAKTQLLLPELPREGDSLSFPAVSLPSSSSKPNAPLKNLSNPSQALAHLTKHNAQLASLPEDRRRVAEERERWAKAEERASGGKVADQEGVLRKAVKRAEKGKFKSGKEWAERKKTLDKGREVAVKKRNDNIALRAEARRNKRMGIKDKGKKDGGQGKGKKGKGKGRPGFEGGRKEKTRKA